MKNISSRSRWVGGAVLSSLFLMVGFQNCSKVKTDLADGVNGKSFSSIAGSGRVGEGQIQIGTENEPVSNLTCPAGFIKVSGNAEYSQKDFCVAKYEMKNGGNNIPVSTADGTPYTVTHGWGLDPSAHRDGVEQLCKSMGDGYDLISNSQWQTVARNITTVDKNWSSGRAYTGLLNTGLYEEKQSAEASFSAGRDDEACLGSRESCNSGTWARNKRTHTLSNGEVIWDLAGNVPEIVKDKFSFSSYVAPYDVKLENGVVEALRQKGYVVVDPSKIDGCSPGSVVNARHGGSICYYYIYEMTTGPVSVYSDNISQQRSLIGRTTDLKAGFMGMPDYFGSNREVKTFGSKTSCDSPVQESYCGYGFIRGTFSEALPFNPMFLNTSDTRNGTGYANHFGSARELTIENLQKYHEDGIAMVRGSSNDIYMPGVCDNAGGSTKAMCVLMKAKQGIFQANPMKFGKAGFRCVYNK